MTSGAIRGLAKLTITIAEEPAEAGPRDREFVL
jgi:hypothetical protein